MNTRSVSTEEAVLEASAFPRKLTDNQRDVAIALSRTREGCGLRPDAYMPKSEHLDQLVNGELTAKLPGKLQLWTEWVFGFNDSMLWYESLYCCALTELKERDPEKAEPEIERRLAELTLLSGEAFEAYAPAREENYKDLLTNSTSEMPITATLELARRYRLYTRYVESLVMEVWPEINRDLLLNP